MASNDPILLRRILDARRVRTAPELSAEDFFEIFLAEQLLWDYDLSWDELKDGIIGGGDDGGIDALYLFSNKALISSEGPEGSSRGAREFELVVLQAKTSKGFSETAVDKIKETLGRLLDLNEDIEVLRGLYKAELLELVNRFRSVYLANADKFPNLYIRIYYGSFGSSVHPKVQRKACDLEKKLTSVFSASECAVSFVTPADLIDLARRERPSVFTLKFSDLFATDTGDGFVGLCPVRDYFTFLSTPTGELRASVFESNVREYEGHRGINESIRNTLNSDNGDDFWWLNNGVTIVAERAVPCGRALQLAYPQVVNGLQTSREIYEYCRATSSSQVTHTLEPRSVLVRVIVPPTEASKDRIIRATNSQTPIPRVALRATDPVQWNLEDYLLTHDYYYERRKRKYQNLGKPSGQIVSIPYLAEAALAAIYRKPHVGALRIGGRFLGDDRIYRRIFNEETPLEWYLKSLQVARFVEPRLRLIRQYGITVRSGRRMARPRRSTAYHMLIVTALVVQTVGNSTLDNLQVEALDGDAVERWVQLITEIDPIGTRGLQPADIERRLTEYVIEAIAQGLCL